MFSDTQNLIDMPKNIFCYIKNIALFYNEVEFVTMNIKNNKIMDPIIQETKTNIKPMLHLYLDDKKDTMYDEFGNFQIHKIYIVDNNLHIRVRIYSNLVVNDLVKANIYNWRISFLNRPNDSFAYWTSVYAKDLW